MDENNFSQAFQELLQNGKQENLARIKREMVTSLAQTAKYRAEFEIRLYLRWQKALDLFETICLLGCDSGAKFNQQIRPYAAKQQDFVFEALTRIHARACQTMSAILSLLKSGHAMDALARARTVHELDVTAYFINTHENEIAEKYLLYQIVESLKAARDYEKHHKRLGLEPLDPETIPSLEREVEKYRSKFGEQFTKLLTKGLYGWAAEAVGKRQPSFEDIEEAVDLSHLRPFYKMASYPTHASAKGLMFDVGDIGTQKVLLAGPSNAGLADAGTMALASFNRCTAHLLCYTHYSSEPALLKTYANSFVASQVINEFVEEANQAFLEANQQLIREELELRSIEEK